jgi:hypothetical protein
MVVHPNTREGIKAIGGIGVAAFIAFEILFGRLSSNADKFARDWYAMETERLRKENNEFALLLAYRSVGDMRLFEDAMREFSGTKYLLQVVPNAKEAIHLTWALGVCLKRSGWIEIEPPGVRENLRVGVTVLTATSPSPTFAAKAEESVFKGVNYG